MGLFVHLYLDNMIGEHNFDLPNPNVYKKFPRTVAIYSYVSLGIGLIGVMLFTQLPKEEEEDEDA